MIRLRALTSLHKGFQIKEHDSIICFKFFAVTNQDLDMNSRFALIISPYINLAFIGLLLLWASDKDTKKLVADGLSS